jgi:hypothetical protein
MKTYGKKPRDCANRRLRGTGMACPCCIPYSAVAKRKQFKKAARRANKKLTESTE